MTSTLKEQSIQLSHYVYVYHICSVAYDAITIAQAKTSDSRHLLNIVNKFHFLKMEQLYSTSQFIEFIT